MDLHNKTKDELLKELLIENNTLKEACEKILDEKDHILLLMQEHKNCIYQINTLTENKNSLILFFLGLVIAILPTEYTLFEKSLFFFILFGVISVGIIIYAIKELFNKSKQKIFYKEEAIRIEDELEKKGIKIV